MRYLCDKNRHLICTPYSIENLHLMAADLQLDRCWFHSTKGLAHYDIPKRRIAEFTSKCTVVSSKEIVRIIKEATTPKPA